MLKSKDSYTIEDIAFLFRFQNQVMKDTWPDFKTIFTDNGIMKISGKWKDSDYRYKYSFEILYHPKYPCEVRIIEPTIMPSASIHMYDNGALCLYHYRDYPRDKQFVIATEIIPWAIEWTLWYEIWLRNGNIWKGPEAAHG